MCKTLPRIFCLGRHTVRTKQKQLLYLVPSMENNSSAPQFFLLLLSDCRSYKVWHRSQLRDNQERVQSKILFLPCMSLLRWWRLQPILESTKHSWSEHKLYYKEFDSSSERSLILLKNSAILPPPSVLPPNINPGGLNQKQKQYLYHEIGQFCNPGKEDLVAPVP